MGVWVERSASVDVEAGADELFIYYSDLENLPVWYVVFALLYSPLSSARRAAANRCMRVLHAAHC